MQFFQTELASSSLQGHEGVYKLDENLRAP